ncbi:MAG: 1-propanol dehydrogenase PduQ [Eubacteriaceae bacterium]|jgi:1-propanol dehydrogenase
MAKFDKTRFFQVRPAIYYGMNALETLGTLDLKHVCIVTDKGMVKFGILKKITDVLDQFGITYDVFDDVEPDPSTEIVEKGLVSLMLKKPEALIALGGGSAIDSAKGIIYYGNMIQSMFAGTDMYKKPYFIALPTTAGTGSEVTEYAVITNKITNTKIALTDDQMLPDAAILDPRLVESVPAGSTAATGMDVLTHAVEAYSSTNNNPFARCYAAKAAELVFKSLYDAYADGHDLNAKASMQIASCMAGIAFNSAGLGITHSLAHAIGAQWHLPHGLANAIVLPYVVTFNGQDAYTASVYGRLLSAMGILNISGNAPQMLTKSVEMLKQELNIPACLKDFGIDEQDYLASRDIIVGKALNDTCTKTNPIAPTAEQMTEVLDHVYYGTKKI